MLPLPNVRDRERKPWRFQRGVRRWFLLGGDVDVFVIGGSLDLQGSQALEEELLLGNGKRCGGLVCSHFESASERLKTM
jgi:hypothetical protein